MRGILLIQRYPHGDRPFAAVGGRDHGDDVRRESASQDTR